MRVIDGFSHKFDKAIVAIGSFDGVHSGHRKLIKMLEWEAKKADAEPVVITFSPHPRQVLRGENRLLSTIEEKLQLLEDAGAKNVVVVNFTKEFAAIEPDVFIIDYLKNRLGAVAMMVGGDHSFGKSGRGGVEDFKRCGLMVISLGRFDSISSTMVRDALTSGDMSLAVKLLDTPYLVKTPVEDKTKLFPPSGTYKCLINSEEVMLSIDDILKIKEEKDIFIVE